MNYTEMSDAQINDAVAIARGSLIRKGKALSLYQVEGADLCTDFCNSWADAGPIIEKHRIAIKPVALYVGGYRWFASVGEDDLAIKAADQNPLRAAMIVFLMMQEAK